MTNNLPPHVFYTADLSALFLLIGAAWGIIPGILAALASLAAFLCYGLQLYDRWKNKNKN